MKYNRLFYGILVAGGLAAGISLGLIRGPFNIQPKTSNSTSVYTANLDGDEKEGYDDLVVGKASGNMEFYLKDSKGNFTNIEELKKKELSDLVGWYDEELKNIKENFDGIRSKLNSN